MPGLSAKTQRIIRCPNISSWGAYDSSEKGHMGPCVAHELFEMLRRSSTRCEELLRLGLTEMPGKSNKTRDR